MKSDTLTSYLANSQKYSGWQRIDPVISTKLCINKFIQNYRHTKNQKRLIYASTEDIDLMRAEKLANEEIDSHTRTRFLIRRNISPKKRFIKIVNLIRFCYRWHTWAKYKYARIFQRFISFAQYYVPNITGESENLSLDDEKALIKAEMMNFKASFIESISTSMSQHAIEILKKTRRSSNDIIILMNTFKDMPHMKYLNRLNSDMLNKILRCCWLEEYDRKRVVAAQYQEPKSFYFVLSGSLVCTYRSNSERKSSTICLLEKGMSFGDLPLMSYSMHTCSLITRSKCQLLVIDRKDFYDIFINSKTTSNKHNKRSSTQESIEYLSKNALFAGWPLHLFEQNTQAIKTCAWARNQIISQGSQNSKYIYIVKRGYISVWTKLDLTTASAKHMNTDEDFTEPKSLLLNEKDSDDGFFKRNNLLEIHHKDVLHFQENSSLFKSKNESETLRDIEAKMKLNEMLAFLESVKKRDRETKLDNNIGQSNIWDYGDKIIKKHPNGTIYYYEDKSQLARINRQIKKKISGILPNISFELTSGKANDKLKFPNIHLNSPITSVADYNRINVNSEFELTHSETYTSDGLSTSSEPIVDISQKFLKIQSVYPGETFGFEDILFDSQPNMQLISNGCECILIQKDFFIQNSTTEYLKKLRRVIYPFPELKEIEANYAKHVKWKKYTNNVLNKTLLNSVNPHKFY